MEKTGFIFLLFLSFASVAEVHKDSSFADAGVNQSKELKGDSTKLSNSFMNIAGVLGATRALVSLTAFNTAMHGYVIHRLHMMGHKIRDLSAAVRALIKEHADHRHENKQAHERTQQDLASHRTESERAHAQTHKSMQQTNQDLLQKMEQLDRRNARRVRRVARLLAKQNERQFAQLLENQQQILANQQQSMIMRILEYAQNGARNNPEAGRIVLKMLRLIR